MYWREKMTNEINEDDQFLEHIEFTCYMLVAEINELQKKIALYRRWLNASNICDND